MVAYSGSVEHFLIGVAEFVTVASDHLYLRPVDKLDSSVSMYLLESSKEKTSI